MSLSALVNFSDAKSLTPFAQNAIRDIREKISSAFEDDEFFQSLGKHFQEPGSAGNRQMDQALIAEAVFNKEPVLRSYDNLNHKTLWKHIAHVLSSYGYEMAGGRITGHRLEHIPTKPEPKVHTAPDFR